MVTQSQLNTIKQPYRNINIKIEVLDYSYYVLDEISGIATSAIFSINADSDIRRTCNIDMVLNDRYSKNKLATEIYWNSGNPFWFDKYLKISIGIDEIGTGETIWNNQGIYLINQPSLLYDAENNSLSFEGVDLMAKLTGLRDGNLEGMGYSIPVGTKIYNAMVTILSEQNFNQYIIMNPPQSTTPYEIRVDAGGTSYDLLSELRDINPNWEMFFDVDGVFYFQEIASNAGTKDDVVPFVDAETFKLLDSSAHLDTSFEDVKNYVEVYGKVNEFETVANLQPFQVEYRNYNVLTLATRLDYDISNIDELGIDVTLSIGDIASPPELFSGDTVFGAFRVYENSYDRELLYLKLEPDEYLKYDNFAYLFHIYKENDVYKMKYYGYVQPFGLAWDDNEESPFYVGKCLTYEPWEYHSGLPKKYSVGDKVIHNGYVYYCFHMPEGDTQEPGAPVPPGARVGWAPLYPFNGLSDMVYNKPKFEKQVRIVLSGGEYDNIYSNELAMQRAKYELYLHSSLHDNIQITLVPIYWMDVNQVIEYQMPNEKEPSYWLVKSVSTDFSVDGKQTITAIRYYFNQ